MNKKTKQWTLGLAMLTRHGIVASSNSSTRITITTQTMLNDVRRKKMVEEFGWEEGENAYVWHFYP